MDNLLIFDIFKISKTRIDMDKREKFITHIIFLRVLDKHK